jgi:hypothetical protein
MEFPDGSCEGSKCPPERNRRTKGKDESPEEFSKKLGKPKAPEDDAIDKEMSESKKKVTENREIDLSGPQGNAYSLMAQAKQWGRQLEMDNINEIISDMKSGDYDHLLDVFEKHFGMIATLVNKPGEDEEY